MENDEIVRAASKVAAYLVKRRSSKITVETPVVTYDDVREALSSLVPPVPSVPDYQLPADLEIALSKRKAEHVEAEVAEEDRPRGAGVACIPCTVSHIAACAGQLNEAIRFARENLADPEVGTRIDRCLSEIAAAERIDLAPENVAGLPQQEREIANDAAKRLRKLRHTLEWYESFDQLEEVAAEMSRLQHDAGEAWRQARLSRLSPEQAQHLLEAAREEAQKIIDEESQTP